MAQWSEKYLVHGIDPNLAYMLSVDIDFINQETLWSKYLTNNKLADDFDYLQYHFEVMGNGDLSTYPFVCEKFDAENFSPLLAALIHCDSELHFFSKCSDDFIKEHSELIVGCLNEYFPIHSSPKTLVDRFADRLDWSRLVFEFEGTDITTGQINKMVKLIKEYKNIVFLAPENNKTFQPADAFLFWEMVKSGTFISDDYMEKIFDGTFYLILDDDFTMPLRKAINLGIDKSGILAPSDPDQAIKRVARFVERVKNNDTFNLLVQQKRTIK